MQTVLVGSEFLAQDLDRNLAPELHVLSQVNLTHSAGAELLENSVMGNFIGIHHLKISHKRHKNDSVKKIEKGHSTRFLQRLVERATESKSQRGARCPASRAAGSSAVVVPATAQ